MNKIYVYLIIVLCLLTAVEAYNSGEIVELYNISECDGPIYVKVTASNKMSDNEIRIEGLINKDNMWVGYCKDNFKVRFITEESIENKYDITIQYYKKYRISIKKNNTNSTIPSTEDVFNEKNKIVSRINNVVVGIPEEEKISFVLNIGTKNAIFFGFFIFIIIGVVVYIKFIKPNILQHKDSDVLNYITKKEIKDEQLDDMIKILK